MQLLVLKFNTPENLFYCCIEELSTEDKAFAQSLARETQVKFTILLWKHWHWGRGFNVECGRLLHNVLAQSL